jgi:hypothetical protein
MPHETMEADEFRRRYMSGTLPPIEEPIRSKYHNEPTLASDGTKCASKKEAKRYSLLLIRQAAGEISGLFPHPSWPLIVNGVKIGKYTADARYLEDGKLVVEDVKSKVTKTEAYGLRKQLMFALHGIEIREV